MSRAPPTPTRSTQSTAARRPGTLRSAASASNMRSTAAATPSTLSPTKPQARSKSRATSPAKPARIGAARDSTPSSPRGGADEKKPVGAASLSLREAIAQKRAEARKQRRTIAAQEAQLGLDDMSNLQDAVPSFEKSTDEPVEVGRWPLKEAIDRARRSGKSRTALLFFSLAYYCLNTYLIHVQLPHHYDDDYHFALPGNINLSTRSLMCLPSALFEIHLGITPAPLASAAEEPRSSSASSHQSSSYYDTHDLEVLKGKRVLSHLHMPKAHRKRS
jgi:hypothetical protein